MLLLRELLLGFGKAIPIAASESRILHRRLLMGVIKSESESGFARKVGTMLLSVQPLCSLCLCG